MEKITQLKKYGLIVGHLWNYEHLIPNNDWFDYLTVNCLGLLNEKETNPALIYSTLEKVCKLYDNNELIEGHSYDDCLSSLIDKIDEHLGKYVRRPSIHDFIDYK